MIIRMLTFHLKKMKPHKYSKVFHSNGKWDFIIPSKNKTIRESENRYYNPLEGLDESLIHELHLRYLNSSNNVITCLYKFRKDHVINFIIPIEPGYEHCYDEDDDIITKMEKIIINKKMLVINDLCNDTFTHTFGAEFCCFYDREYVKKEVIEYMKTIFIDILSDSEWYETFYYLYVYKELLGKTLTFRMDEVNTESIYLSLFGVEKLFSLNGYECDKIEFNSQSKLQCDEDLNKNFSKELIVFSRFKNLHLIQTNDGVLKYDKKSLVN